MSTAAPGSKKKLAMTVIERLKKEYPDAVCTLDYGEPWQLLVSVRLAAQCTDARVDRTTPALYSRFPDIKALAEAPVEEIEEIIKPCGFHHSKARDISGCMKRLIEHYDGRVPDTMEELLTLPGVGRKSANLILGDVYGKPAIVVDTHCIRICRLTGLVPEDEKDPVKIEMRLKKIVPPEEGNSLCHRFVLHGRAVCIARRPGCDRCCLKDVCRYGKKKES